MLGGVLAGPLIDRYGLKYAAMFGSAMICTATFFVAQFPTSHWGVNVAVGIMGYFVEFSIFPCYMLADYFLGHESTVIASIAGSSYIGTLVPPSEKFSHQNLSTTKYWSRYGTRTPAGRLLLS